MADHAEAVEALVAQVPPAPEHTNGSILEVCALGASADASEDAWDRFVDASPDGTVFHRIAWKLVVEEVFGHVPHYLVAHAAGVVRGVLPLFEVRGLRAGRVLLSVPHGTYGGICATDPAAASALLEAARDLGERLRVRYVELRQLSHPLPALPTCQPFVTFTRAIAADPDANFRALSAKRRNMIRKGARHGLEIRRGWEPLAEFHQTYAINCHRLGSPPYSRRLFEAIRDRLGASAELLTVWHRAGLVAGSLSLFHGNRIMPYYTASLPAARTLAVNDFMYWDLMRTAGLSGYRLFDFGQSHAGSGSYAFKHYWGFAPEPIAHQYVLVRDHEPPLRDPARRDPLVDVWKRLPLPLTKWLGPSLIRWLPLR